MKDEVNICYAVGSKLIIKPGVEKHVLFVDIDTDKHDDKRVLEESYAIMKFCRLSHVAVYRTRHGYNLVSFDLHDADEVAKIHNIVKNDSYHSMQFNEYGQWFLRLSSAKVLVTVLLNDERQDKDISFAHMLEFKRNGMLGGDEIDKIIMNTFGNLRSGMIRIDYYKRKKEVENG